MQSGKGRQQSFAHVGPDGGRRLAPADQLRRIEIHRNHLGEGAAEIDEKGEGRHFGSRVELDCSVEIQYRFYSTVRFNHEVVHDLTLAHKG